MLREYVRLEPDREPIAPVEHVDVDGRGQQTEVLRRREQYRSVARRLSVPHPSELHVSMPRKHLKDARRTLVDNFFREPFGRPSPDELAALIGVSRRQLERILREYYGLSFTEKVTATRIELAKDMLGRTALPVRDVAEAAGFSSLEYFSRVFKRQVGLPPGAYREGHAETASRQGPSGVVQ